MLPQKSLGVEQAPSPARFTCGLSLLPKRPYSQRMWPFLFLRAIRIWNNINVDELARSGFVW